MRVSKIGKRSFAFELQWLALDERDPKEFAASEIPIDIAVDSGEQPVWTAIKAKAAGGEGVFGWSTLEPGMPSKVWSYAEALARNAEPGIYVSPIDESQLWYVAIADGMPIASTDVVRPRDDAIESIRDMAQISRMKVLVAAGSGITIPGAGEFDAERVIGKVKFPAMRAVGRSWKDTAAIGLILVSLISMGVVLKMHFFPAQRRLTPAEAMAHQRQSYIRAAQRAIKSHPIPVDASWAVHAIEDGQHRYPSAYAGFKRKEVSCSPANCVATYQAAGKGVPMSIGALQRRIGARLTFDKSGEVLVENPLPHIDTIKWPVSKIVAPPTGNDAAIAIGGDVLSTFASVDMSKPLLTELARMPGSMGRSAIFAETVKVVAEFPEPVQVKGITALYAEHGMSPIQIEFDDEHVSFQFSRLVGGMHR